MKNRQKEEMLKKYTRLDPSDERKYMSDREILEKYIDLDMSCLTDTEKNKVMDMLCKNEKAFSLRDEIGNALT